MARLLNKRHDRSMTSCLPNESNNRPHPMCCFISSKGQNMDPLLPYYFNHLTKQSLPSSKRHAPVLQPSWHTEIVINQLISTYRAKHPSPARSPLNLICRHGTIIPQSNCANKQHYFSSRDETGKKKSKAFEPNRRNLRLERSRDPTPKDTESRNR